MEFDISKKILVIGRAGMDIYPEPQGTKIFNVKNFSSHLGGSAANTCAAFSKLNISNDLVTCISNDAIGEYIFKKLNEFKIGTKHCQIVDKSYQTQVAVVETILENNESILYRTNPCDLQLNTKQINKINFEDYSCLFISGTALSSEPSRQAIFFASQKAKQIGIPQIIDLDYRPYNWESEKIKSETYKKIMERVDIVIGNELEFNVADNSQNGFELSKSIMQYQPSIVIYKKGEKGSIVITRDKITKFGIYPVKAIKPTGAGDAFNGGFTTSISKGNNIFESVLFGSACAAIVVKRVGCSSAMPTLKEVNYFMSKNSINT